MRARVLIVEDELIIADDIAGQLARMGYEVLGTAIAGEEAIQMAEQLKPDVVLMDIQLEGVMTGTEAACTIQERTGAGIVFVTAYPGVLVERPPQLKEPTICIGKPFSRSQLDAALSSSVAGR